MRLLACLALLLFATVLSAQMDLLALRGQWDDNTLPATASQNQYNDIWGYVDCAGNEYALLGSRRYVHVFELSAAGVPTEVTRIEGRADGTADVTWRDLKTYGTVAYGVCDNCAEGMLIIDLSGLPTAATLTTRNTTWFAKAHNIHIDVPNGRLYAVGTNTRPNGVIVLDIATDPLHPTLLASVNLPGTYIHDIHVVNNIAYASHGNNGLYIYDFTTPASPQFLGSIDNYTQQGYNHSSWLDPARGVLVWADETLDRSVKIADVSDPSDIMVTDLFRSELLAPAATGSIAHNPFIRDNYVVVSYYDDGIQIFDITDETDVVQVAGYDTEPTNTDYATPDGAWGAYPYLPSGYILGSDVLNGLFVLEWTQQPFAANSAIGGPASNGPTTACNGAVLPVVLTAFSARRRGAAEVLLHWETTLEQHTATFVVEFSTDGRAFVPVGTVAAAGNSADRQLYAWTHRPPETAVAYYRLRVVEEDESAHYSEVVVVRLRSALPEWIVAPNPVRESLTLLGPAQRTDTTYRILDLTGTRQRSGTLRGTPTIALDGLAAGTYVLELSDGQRIERKRFVRVE